MSYINLHDVVHVGLSEIISCSCHVTCCPHLSSIIFILEIIETSATCIKGPFWHIKIAAKWAITPTNQPRMLPSYGSVSLSYSCHLYNRSSRAVSNINLHVVVHVGLSEIISCSCHVTRFFYEDANKCIRFIYSIIYLFIQILRRINNSFCNLQRSLFVHFYVTSTTTAPIILFAHFD